MNKIEKVTGGVLQTYQQILFEQDALKKSLYSLFDAINENWNTGLPQNYIISGCGTQQIGNDAYLSAGHVWINGEYFYVNEYTYIGGNADTLQEYTFNLIETPIVRSTLKEGSKIVRKERIAYLGSPTDPGVLDPTPYNAYGRIFDPINKFASRTSYDLNNHTLIGNGHNYVLNETSLQTNVTVYGESVSITTIYDKYLRSGNLFTLQTKFTTSYGSTIVIRPKFLFNFACNGSLGQKVDVIIDSIGTGTRLIGTVIQEAPVIVEVPGSLQATDTVTIWGSLIQ